MTSQITEVNKRQWSSRFAQMAYRNADYLYPIEQAMLEAWADRIGKWHMLDIGVGTGRTTIHFADLCASYTGIDYAEEMIRKAEQRFPAADFAVADATDMKQFEDGTFDLVMFSYNGIDYSTHEDRLKILAEIRRVLRPEGLLFFASHNRDFRYLGAVNQVARIPWSWNPRKLVKDVGSFSLSHFNTWRYKHREVEADEYMLLNDSACCHGLLCYYISREQQVKQLARIGFAQVRAFEISGRELSADEVCRGDFMIHYVARRAPDHAPQA